MACRSSVGRVRGTLESGEVVLPTRIRLGLVVREEDGRVGLEVVLAGAQAPPELGSVVDRIQALGGELTVSSEGDEVRVVATLPVSR